MPFIFTRTQNRALKEKHQLILEFIRNNPGCEMAQIYREFVPGGHTHKGIQSAVIDLETQGLIRFKNFSFFPVENGIKEI